MFMSIFFLCAIISLLTVLYFDMRRQRNRAIYQAETHSVLTTDQNALIRDIAEKNTKLRRQNRKLLEALSTTRVELNNAHLNLERVLMHNPPTNAMDEIGVEIGRNGVYYTFSKKELSLN